MPSTPAPPATPEARAAYLILTSFVDYHGDIRTLSRRGRTRFGARDFSDTRALNRARIDCYGTAVTGCVSRLRGLMGEPWRALWADVKEAFATLIADRSDEEIAETFFNSVTRQLFTVVGVETKIEFIWFDSELTPSGDETPIYRSHHRTTTTVDLIRELLEETDLAAPFADPERDAARLAELIDARAEVSWGHLELHVIEVAKPVFYRNKAAYLLGRVRRANRIIPMAIALTHGDDGVEIDAVLLTEPEVSRVFSLTRSYFFVDVQRPSELIGFLRSLMPMKSAAELYIGLGYIKHGKTVMFRELHRHLIRSSDKFVVAPGTKGMVMTVFTLPSYDLVFKIIKDEFDFPKNTSHNEVKDRYELVIELDRAGRLLGANEFEHLSLPRDRFSEALIKELELTAGRSITITEEEVVFPHVYFERRLYPLNIYVEDVSRDRAVAAVIDYGQAIKDLAAANVFPGDLLVKNFGVTRYGRVVFYDYDELCLLTDVRFRRKPEPVDDDEEMSQEPWFFVGENDVFPEEFRNFLWPPGELRETMAKHHDDIFGVALWRGYQQQLKKGELLDVYPYSQSRRFARLFSGGDA